MKVNILKKLVHAEQQEDEDVPGSVLIQDAEERQKFLSNPDNTLLVSFPRTGSHWLRMLMELYFERPSLVRVFYYPERKDYLTYHTHDMQLEIEHPTILYLYRDPVDTIYSQLRYHKESINDHDRILYWSNLYGRHLEKWLVKEKFTRKKTILHYEGFKADMAAEFAKVTQHFGLELDGGKLALVAARVTHEEVKEKTVHDPQVINAQMGYDAARKKFCKKFSELIWRILLYEREYLNEYFKN